MDSPPASSTLAERPHAARYHVANCEIIVRRTATDQRSDLVVTGRLDGYFEVEIQVRAGLKLAIVRSELHVCKKCLTALNYDGYADAHAGEQERIWADFSVSEFARGVGEPAEDVAELFETRPVLGMALFRHEILSYLHQLAEDYDVYLRSYESTSSNLWTLAGEGALDQDTAARIRGAIHALNAASHGDNVAYSDVSKIVELRNGLLDVLDAPTDPTRIRLVELRGKLEQSLRDLARAARVSLAGTHGIRSRLDVFRAAGRPLSGHELSFLRTVAHVVDAAAGSRPIRALEATRAVNMLPPFLARLSKRISTL